MWMFVLCTLVLTHGALAEVDCSKNAYDECKRPNLFYFVPTDVSEYNRLCPELAVYLRCLKDFQDQCEESSGIFRSQVEYDGKHGVFRELCEDGTFLNKVVTENLRCFNQTFQTTSCPDKMKDIFGPYRSPMHDPEDEHAYTLPIEIMCLQNILQSNCIAVDFGKNCGEESLTATREFLRRFYYLEDTCGKRNAQTLMRGLDAFRLDPEQKAFAVATLQKIIDDASK